MTSPDDVAAAVKGKGSSPVRLVRGVGAKVYEQLPGGKETPVREAVQVLRAAADGQRPSPKLNLLERFLEEVDDLVDALACTCHALVVNSACACALCCMCIVRRPCACVHTNENVHVSRWTTCQRQCRRGSQPTACCCSCCAQGSSRGGATVCGCSRGIAR